jgi:phosphoserine phosphatase
VPKTLITFFALIGAAACGDDHSITPMPDAAESMPDAPVDSPPEVPSCQPKSLRTDLTWANNNRADLEGWLASRGCNSTGYDKTKKPVALFDWDNTISKNDFGDAITFWFVANDKVIRPAAWSDTSAFMTADGVTALSAACDGLAAVGSPLPTSTNSACADEILSMYIDNLTVGGKTAFMGHDYRRMEPTYAWTAQLMAGYTDTQITQFATSAIGPQLTATEGATQTIGARTINGWLRIYDQTKDVIDVAKSYGYDVWIITASPQPVIQAFSPMVGIAADHVIGIRSMLDSNGNRTYKFQGCGDTLDDNQTMISYVAGKRCWVNKVVYGDNTATAMRRRPDGDRQVFAAGDSDTDIEFLRDATYRLVIDRNKTELMCNAFYASDTWRVNPMFILPKVKKTSAYPCSTTGFKTETGGTAPIRDDANNIIPNQIEP